MTSLTDVKDKVQRYLTARFGSILVDPQGDYSFCVGATRIFVRVRPWAKSRTAVSIFAPLLVDVPLTQELKDYVALEGDHFPFGRMGLRVNDESGDSALLLFSYAIFGDYLDEEELANACLAVALVVDERTAELKRRFGGRCPGEDD
ncbi:MAG: hypothetical protein D6815_11170 [Candidatus Dadabacteria bacterium]|nr:MAG: hypothetical protein D6815_11170 [Candidatus Dadabacteria bacterium]